MAGDALFVDMMTTIRGRRVVGVTGKGEQAMTEVQVKRHPNSFALITRYDSAEFVFTPRVSSTPTTHRCHPSIHFTSLHNPPPADHYITESYIGIPYPPYPLRHRSPFCVQESPYLHVITSHQYHNHTIR